VKRSSKASGMFGLGYIENFLHARAEIIEKLRTAFSGLSEVNSELGGEAVKVEAGVEEGWIPSREGPICLEKP